MIGTPPWSSVKSDSAVKEKAAVPKACISMISPVTNGNSLTFLARTSTPPLVTRLLIPAC
jgi:hypothetical protein